MITIGILLEGQKQGPWCEAFAKAAEDWNHTKDEAAPSISIRPSSIDTLDKEEHKVDVMLCKPMISVASKHEENISALLEFAQCNPDVAFDGLQSVIDLCDRGVTVGKLEGLHVEEDGQICTQPQFVVSRDSEQFADIVREAPFEFPWVCKPIVADGIPESHNLGLVWSSNARIDVPYPVVLQQFINHSAVIFKVYVLGDHVMQIMRHSLPDVQYGADPSKGYEPFGRISNARADCRALTDDDVEEKPSAALMERLAAEVGSRLGVSLFGMDLIRDQQGRFYLIDVNYLPGYYGVDNVFQRIIKMCAERVQKRI